MINTAFIIRAVAAQRNDVTVDVSQKIRNNRRVVTAVGSQFRSDDLLGFSVYRNVKFTPSSTFAPSVFVNLPFALAVNLQPSTVDHNVKSAALAIHFERNVQRFRTFAKGRIIGNSRFLNFSAKRYLLDKGKKFLMKELSYFVNNQRKVNYAVFRSQGLPIGSGPVEAACKTIVKARLCCSGMRWTRRRAQEILRIRTTIKNNRWNVAWLVCKYTPTSATN